MKCARFEDEPEFKAGLVDKDEQARHIFDRTGDSFFTAQGIPPLAFLLHGTDSQWPYALLFILYYQIKKQISIRNTASVEPLSPEPVQLSGKVYKSAASPENYLWELLAEKLVCAPTRVEIGRALSNKHAPHLLYRKLTEAESQNQELVCGMLEAWESLEFAHNTPRHMLVLYYEQTDRPQSIWFFWQKKGDTLIDKIHRFLPEQSCMKYVLPEIKSPNRRLIHEWIDSQFGYGSRTQEIRRFVEAEIMNEFDKRKTSKNKIKEPMHHILITKDDIEIHHYDLKNILIDALKKYG